MRCEETFVFFFGLSVVGSNIMMLLERLVVVVAVLGVGCLGVWDLEEVNPLVIEAQYAVRGAILARAQEIEKELKEPSLASKWPFTRVVRCNIGNPQALGQLPPAFARQVLSLVMNPSLMTSAAASFDPEALSRAEKYLEATTGGVGAYSDSKGIALVREEVAKFIELRDGFPADPEMIFLTDGASAGVRHVTQALIRKPSDAILTPFPQYPLYSALTTLSNGSLAPYYLDEVDDWGVALGELERAYAEAVTQGKTPRALVVINPGNPTGALLDATLLGKIVDFARKYDLVLLADEVYQENVYGAAGHGFISLKKILRQKAYTDVSLVSFHSISKGVSGECGIRGGYLELVNVPDTVVDQLVKLASISLCSNVPGQIGVGLMVNPPSATSEAGQRDLKDKAKKMESLEKRSLRIATALDALPGVTCAPAEGALYLFPNVLLPPKAVEAAATKNIAPDALYSLSLLEATGLVVVPGSGFGQKNGTFHFRTTFLPQADEIDSVLKRLADFHNNFLATYASPSAEL